MGCMEGSKMRFGIAFALCWRLALASGWKQDRFAISIWVDPMVPPDEFPARYAEMRRANISVLLGGFGATSPETVAASLRACEQRLLIAPRYSSSRPSLRRSRRR